MDNEPKPGGMLGLGLVHVVCCGGLVLVVSGALSGLGAWLSDGGLTWLALAFVVCAGGGFLWRRRRSDRTPLSRRVGE